jgi:hypothetical protein
MANQPQQFDEPNGFIERASGFTFFLMCIASGLLAGSLLFLISGLSAAAFEASPSVLTLLRLAVL